MCISPHTGEMHKTYIVDALRLHFKARNITYKELGEAIGLSEEIWQGLPLLRA